MPCKICGKPFGPEFPSGHQSVSFKIPVNCNCGKIRARIRAKGCPKCGRTDPKRITGGGIPNIVLTKRWWFTATCVCGHKWRLFR
jgi:hypothetical protein